MAMSIIKIASGGQTGADRGGLDAAIQSGVPHGGWCPKGRRAEDGVIPSVYRLKETKSSDYRARTEANVEASDATVIFTRGKLDGGSLLTAEFARKHLKPHLHLDLSAASVAQAAEAVLIWLEGLGGERVVLNVAGQRESKSPGIQAQVGSIMGTVLSRADVGEG